MPLSQISGTCCYITYEFCNETSFHFFFMFSKSDTVFKCILVVVLFLLVLFNLSPQKEVENDVNANLEHDSFSIGLQ